MYTMANNLLGKTFGRLLVTAFNRSELGKGYLWDCRCVCGNSCTVQSKRLSNGSTRSCGCLAKETRSSIRTTHAWSKTRLYTIWKGMKARCYNKNDNNYKRYGERGIEVCNDWKFSFEQFRDWSLENGYKDNLSIDRIDNNGNYDPANCRWTNRETQSSNTRRNSVHTYNNKTQTLKQWAIEYDLNYNMLYGRIMNGWDFQAALEIPSRKTDTRKNQAIRNYAHEKHVRLYEVASKLGKSPSWIGYLLRKDLTKEQTDELIKTIDHLAEVKLQNN